MKKIRIESEFIKKIAKEFSTSTQTVRMSLQYVYHSDLAKSIRKRAIELLIEEAENAKKLFVTNFGKNPALANKIFRFDSKLISETLNNKKDLEVYFSQDLSGNLCIVLKTGSDFYEITTNSSRKITENDRQTRSNLFKGNLRSTIETALNKSYTEYVTIPYISNFDQFNGNFPQTIVLVPAISVTKYVGRMTLIMNFEDFSGKTIFEKVGDTSYDTFSPHP